MTSPHISSEGTEILRVLCGSRAYGLATSGSDFDYHGVFVVPTKRLLSIGPKSKETAWIEGEEQDNTAWEVGHFLKLAVHCNPTVLETFVAPVVVSLPVGDWLREQLPNVLARRRIYEAFKGYAHNQRTKMFEPSGGTQAVDRMIKAAIAYVRSLYHGIELLQRGTYDPYINDEGLRQQLLALKAAPKLDEAEVVRLAMGLEGRLTDAYLSSTLPDEPNMEAVNEVLIAIRTEFWR